MKKILESVGEIRLDVGEHRICLEDVLCFLTGRDVYDHVAQRFKTLASTHGLKALSNALARTHARQVICSEEWEALGARA